MLDVITLCSFMRYFNKISSILYPPLLFQSRLKFEPIFFRKLPDLWQALTQYKMTYIDQLENEVLVEFRQIVGEHGDGNLSLGLPKREPDLTFRALQVVAGIGFHSPTQSRFTEAALASYNLSGDARKRLNMMNMNMIFNF